MPVAPRTTQRIADEIAKGQGRLRAVGPLLAFFRDFIADPDELVGPISYEDYEGFVICLEGTLGTTTASDSDQFTIPSTHKFLVDEIRGHFGWSATPATDSSMQFAATGITLPSEAIQQKQANTQIALKILDRSRKIIDGTTISLLDVSPLGAGPIRFNRAPLIIPNGYKLQMDLTATTATAAAQGANFNSGLILIGSLLRC